MAFTPKMPLEIQNLVANMTPMTKSYCEHRAAGHKQGTAAIKAGSKADGPHANRVGYQIEQMPGTKDYILWLQQERCKASSVDDAEIISLLRDVYRESMSAASFKDANRSIELMATIAGMLGKNPVSVAKKEAIVAERESTNAFKDQEGDSRTEDRIKDLQRMMKDLNVTNTN